MKSEYNKLWVDTWGVKNLIPHLPRDQINYRVYFPVKDVIYDPIVMQIYQHVMGR